MDPYTGKADPYGKSPYYARDPQSLHRHRLEWTARSLGRYSEELVREFYTSYVATRRSNIDRRATPIKQALLENVRVCCIQVDISLPAIRR